MPFQKGNKEGNKAKGVKKIQTLLKEQRRQIFEDEISQIWKDTIKKLKPEYVADQFMGSAPQELTVRLPKPISDVLKDASIQEDSKADAEN